MSSSDFPDLLHKIDQLLLRGQVKEAIQWIEKIRLSHVDAKYRAELSTLARRMDMPDFALKVVWENTFVHANPTESDILACANAFRRLGVNRQALRLLGQLTPTVEVLLSKSFCKMAEWEYQQAVELLQQCLDSADMPAEKNDLVKVNLIASLLASGHLEQSVVLMNQLEESGLSQRNKILYSNCQELKIQTLLESREYDQALKQIEVISQSAAQQTPLGELFFRKWKIFTGILSDSMDIEDAFVRNFLVDVRKMGHWETLRHFDLIVATKTKDQEILNHVYFGTPYSSFRNKIELIGKPWPSYVWYDKRQASKDINRVDSYQIDNKKLKFGLTNHRLLLLLASDFYRPKSVEQIFDRLFEDEFYNPETSRKRVHQQVKNLRAVLEECNIEVQLDATSEGYRLRPLHKHGFLVHRKMIFSSQEELVCSVVGEKPSVDFSKKELMQLIDLGKDQWFRLLKKLIENGHVTVSGSGSGQRYRFSSM